MKKAILLLYEETKTSKMNVRPIFEAYTGGQHRAQDSYYEQDSSFSSWSLLITRSS